MSGETGQVQKGRAGSEGDETLNKDKATGLLVLAGSLVGVCFYGWLLFFSQWAILALELTCFVVIALVLGILAWIGYTLIVTVPPESAREVEQGFEHSEKPSE